MLKRLQDIFSTTLLQSEQYTIAYKQINSKKFDNTIFIVCVTCALCLVFINYSLKFAIWIIAMAHKLLSQKTTMQKV